MHQPLSVATRLNDAWEAVQVELRGRYSLARLHEILQHAKQTKRWQHICVMLLTPVPVLCLIICMDVLPLNPPEDGVLDQTIGLHLRLILVVTILAYMATSQARQSSPTLPLSTARHWWITLIIGFVCFAVFIGLGVFVGFPTPFVMHMVSMPWTFTWFPNLWAAWKDTFKTDLEAKRKVVHYVTVVFSAQLAMVFIYCVYLVAFTTIPASFQTYFTFLLPVIKLAFKNWVIHGAKYMEDLAPTTVVFNVDVFHAIFVSSSMQSASSMGSVFVVMAIDVVQGLVAYYEVSKVLRLANKFALQSIADSSSGAVENRSQSQHKLKLGVIDFALDVIDANPRIRGHPDVAQPQHHRASQQQALSTMQDIPSEDGPTTEKLAASRPSTQRKYAPQIVPVRPTLQAHDSQHLPHQLDSMEQAQLECVKSALKMLHMVEFYVLIEFVEVVVPVINTVTMRPLIDLPNRVYYTSLADLTQAQMNAQADRVALYACMELLSLVVFCYLMDRKLRHTSTYQILAFVLHKHARVALSALTMWVFLIVQLGLRHFGVDYSFQFAWLHATKPTA